MIDASLEQSPFPIGSILLASQRFVRVIGAMENPGNNGWEIKVRFANGTIEAWHSDLLAWPPKPSLVWRKS